MFLVHRTLSKGSLALYVSHMTDIVHSHHAPMLRSRRSVQGQAQQVSHTAPLVSLCRGDMAMAMPDGVLDS